MAREQTNEKARQLLGEMVERVTDYYNDVYGDGTIRAHYRNTWHVEEVVGYIEESGEWKFKAYNFQTDKEEDLLLDPETLNKILTEGVEVIVGQEEDSDVCGVDTTRIINYPSVVKVLLGRYICREWVTPNIHYVETYEVKNVMYDPEMALYKLTMYSLERRQYITLFYLSGEVVCLLRGIPCLVETVRTGKGKRRHTTSYENTFLLPVDSPQELSIHGTEWLLSDEGREWLKWEVKTDTLARSPKPLPQRKNGRTPKDGRLTPRAVVEEVGLHSHPNIVNK